MTHRPTKSVFDHFQDAVKIVQAEKHKAQTATARCARDADWDSEAYYRAKAEGLAEAEKIVRGYADELRDVDDEEKR